MINETHQYTVTITSKTDGSVVRVMKADHYFIDNCNYHNDHIPNIRIYFKDPDGNYRTAFYPLALYDFEILDFDK